MTINRAAMTFALAVALAGAGAGAAPAARREGLNLNSFVQQGPVAAHIVLRSGSDPRLLVAFPAGNSGVGLWFDKVAADALWSMTGPARPVTLPDARGRPLNGVVFEASVRAPRLVARQAVLSSVRVLRDYQGLGRAPAEVLTRPEVAGNTMTWVRDRLDGAPGYRLVIQVKSGRLEGTTIVAGRDGLIRLSVTALTGEPALTPYPAGSLLEAGAAADPAARTALEFLSYHEKFLAGSWRFNTYFGRDTLLSMRLLMPVLKPAAVEAGLTSVLERLSDDGNVAHEEDIGEFAILDHKKADGSLSAAPVYDYKMIDSAFLLAPVAGAWLVDDKRGQARAIAFLAQKIAGRPLGEAMIRNIRYVAAQATPFAADPRFDKLISLRAGMDAGEWRDSNDGLGGGRYPYDVNAVLVPAALEAAAAMHRAHLLDRYATASDRALLDRLAGMATIWRTRAAPLFAQTMSVDAARPAIAAYAKTQGVPAGPALAAASGLPTRFNAISLDGAGRPIPILNSDDGFALLFGNPSAEQLAITAATIERPFPAGLMTGAGMLVANPVFASAAVKARFGSNAYHGTVVWSWQQALVAAGLARQLARTDLAPGVCGQLLKAQSAVWTAIDASKSVQSSELWSWRFANGRYEIVPFGASGADADESNAAQLWSTVYLAVQRPAVAKCAR
ncbi:hypothetical protein [Glacieibacterium sp.]|uniref:hypothetical protein n=1 Tax=Glacieibacterium sp. TaxID=2860237 RepID=UPI003B00F4B3